MKLDLGYAIVFAATLVVTQLAIANPVVENVAAGNVAIQQTSNTTQVNQTSQRAIINWQSFNINAQEHTHFQQPTGGVALNRIDPRMGASAIYGKLTATGKIILINQAGIYFGPGAYVDVGGLIASTRDMSDAHFLAGKYIFDQASSEYRGSVINQGFIRAANHGLVALLGSSVSNDGTIQARLGNIVLASGDKFTIDLSGDQLINFSVDSAAQARGVDEHGNPLTAAVSNNGTLLADGGKIILSAKSAQGVLDNVINMNGVAQAHSVSQKNGVIIFSNEGGTVTVAGKVDVSGKENNQRGGTVKILGKTVKVKNSAVIDASGHAGGGQILVGGNYQGKGSEYNAWSTQIAAGALLNADALHAGNGGEIIVWADNDTTVAGSLFARGGAYGGNGGFIETSGKNFLNVAGILVNTLAPHGITGTWLLDPTNIYIALNQANATAAGMVGNDSSASSGGPGTFAASGAVQDSLLTIDTLTAALATTNVEVTTNNPAGLGVGNITVVDSFNWHAPTTLTLNAANNITLNSFAHIENTSTGSLVFNAAGDITTQANSGIQMSGGMTSLTGTNIQVNGKIDGATDLLVTGSTFTLMGGIGGIVPLASVVVDAAMTVGGLIATTGDQTYHSTVNVISNTPFIGNNIVFNDTVTGDMGTNNLTIMGTGANSVVHDIVDFFQVNFLGLAGSAILTLNGNGNYTNIFNVFDGTVVVPNNITFAVNPGDAVFTVMGNNGVLRLDNSSTIDIGSGLFHVIDGGTVLAGAGSNATITGAGSMVLSNTANIGGAGNITINTPILDGSAFFAPVGVLQKIGSGTVTLTRANSYQGGTAVTAGTLVAANSGSLGTLGDVSVSNNATLRLIDSITIDLTGRAFNLSGTLSGANGGGTLAGAITLLAPAVFNIEGVNDLLRIEATVDGSYALSLTGNGMVFFLNNVGGGTPLASIISSNTVNTYLVGLKSITTLGSQTYNGSFGLGSVADPMTLNIVNSGSITFAGGIKRTTFHPLQAVLNLNGGSGDTQFIIGGPLTDVYQINVTGGAGNNTLSFLTEAAQTWNITGTNSGTVTPGFTGPIGLQFANIQNLTGGSGANTFIFADNARISGTLNGGSGAASGNQLYYTAYTTPITAFLNNNLISGTIRNNANIPITVFTNIGTLNASNNSTVQLPNKQNTIYFNDARQAYINDPFYVNGFSTFIGLSGLDQVVFNVPATQTSSSTVVINGQTVYFQGISLGPSPTPDSGSSAALNSAVVYGTATIQQPNVQSSSSPDSVAGEISVFSPVSGINQNLAEIVAQQDALSDQEQRERSFTTHCSS